jgi:cell division protease FtsH
MDEELGMVVYEENPDYTFVKPYSESTAQTIDAKVKAYLEDAYKISKQHIVEYKATLEKIAKMLIEKEFISGDEFTEMIDNPEKIDEFIKENMAETKKKSANEKKIEKPIKKKI